MTERVRVSMVGGIADVRFNRPDKHNALDPEQFATIIEVGEDLKRTASVRAIVLSGNGPSFCSGADLAMFAAPAGARPERGDPLAMTAGTTSVAQQAAWIWREQPVPVIAAIHGIAFGGGLQIALCADVRIVHPSAKLSMREASWGLTPDMTGTLMLSRLVRDDIARELIFTARVVSGIEAADLGVATSVSPEPLEAALAMARTITLLSPDAVRAAKRLLTPISADEVSAQFRNERAEIRALLRTANHREALRAQQRRVAPSFVDLPAAPSEAADGSPR